MKEKLRKYRKLIAVIVPAFAILVVALFFVFKTENNNPLNDATININKEENMVKRKLYLLTNDNLVVPVTVSFEKKDSFADELYYVVSLLREDSKAIKGSFKGVLNKDVSILELNVENKVLTLGFSKEFNNYEKECELRIVESLVWTMSQYDEIDILNIKVDGQLLTKMPFSAVSLLRQWYFRPLLYLSAKEPLRTALL